MIGHQFQSVNGYDPLLQADYSVSLGYMAYLGYMPVHVFWEGGWLPDVLRVTTLLASPYAGPVSSRFTYSHSYTLPNHSVVSPTTNIYTYTPRLPESYLIGATRVAPLDVARTALTVSTDTDLTQYAYVDPTTVPTSSLFDIATINQPGFSGAVLDGSMNDGGSGSWTVTAARPSLFVTSYAWMDGWHATVDGKSVPVARTNAVVLGVPVPAGTHTVHLSFTPPGMDQRPRREPGLTPRPRSLAGLGEQTRTVVHAAQEAPRAGKFLTRRQTGRGRAMHTRLVPSGPGIRSSARHTAASAAPGDARCRRRSRSGRAGAVFARYQSVTGIIVVP